MTSQAPSKSLEAKRRESLICCVCREVFRQPKLLPCHHTFCLQCLRQLIAHSSTKTLHCPQCRQEVPVPPGGANAFQDNFYILPEDLEAARGHHSSDVVQGSSDIHASPVTADAVSSNIDTTSDLMIALALASEESSGMIANGLQPDSVPQAWREELREIEQLESMEQERVRREIEEREREQRELEQWGRMEQEREQPGRGQHARELPDRMRHIMGPLTGRVQRAWSLRRVRIGVCVGVIILFGTGVSVLAFSFVF